MVEGKTMKMHRQDYLALQAAIEKRFNAADRVAIWSRYAARGLSAERFRWDMMSASGFDYIAFYDCGLSDNHISTALKNILPIREKSS